MPYTFNKEKVQFEPIYKKNYLELFDPSSIILIFDHRTSERVWLWRGVAISLETKSIAEKIVQKFISELLINDKRFGRFVHLELLIIDEGREPSQFRFLLSSQYIFYDKLTPEEKNTKPSWPKSMVKFVDVNFDGEVPEYELDEDENWKKTEQKSIVMSYHKAGSRSSQGMRRAPDHKWLFPPTFKYLVSSHNKKPPQELITDAIEWFKEDQKNVKRIIIKDGIINILNAKTEEERKMDEINNDNKEKKSKSVCFTSIPINAAIKAADELFGTELSYNPINDFQKEYLEKFFDKDDAKYDFVKRIASFKREDIQKFLNENGFPDIIVPSFDPPNYGIAGVMDQIVEWLFEGKSTKMKGQDGNVYDAVQFNAENEFVTWCYSANRSSYHSEFVVRIRTKSDDMVFLTFLNTGDENETKFGFEMMELAQKITDESKDWNEFQSLLEIHGDNKLIIPKIDFEGEIYVQWMLGLQCSNGMHLDWAKMKAKLKLNHLGARAQAAFASGMLSSGIPIPEIIIFDRPFMIWFTHQEKVTFVMYVGYEHWKDPGDDIFS